MPTTAPSRGSSGFFSPKRKVARTMSSERPSLLRPPSTSKPSTIRPELPSSHSQLRRQPDRTASGDHSLKLPGLPRFHPANFPSSHSSIAATPSSGLVSPEAPISPRAQQRQFSEAQKQLFAYQRELLAAAGRGSWNSAAKPTSPKLAPLGSPGPVTPLELEGDGYLMAGTHSPSKKKQEYLDKLITDEVARSGGDVSSRRPTSVDSY